MAGWCVLADSDLFGDDCIDQLDHRSLWLNLIYWVTPVRGAAGEAVSPTGIRIPTGWSCVRRPTRWRCCRPRTAHCPADAEAAAPTRGRNHTRRSAAGSPLPASGGVSRRASWPTCDAWMRPGFRQAGFHRSLAAFRPEQQRVDGLEHLVFFPMYKQNGSRDTCFEALLIRVPWPDWIAALERTRYDNPKFVPVQLLSGTRGYDSECAVLFPETVSVAGRPVNNFGAIFCDREAARLRRVAGAAADLLALNLPPDAARLLESPRALGAGLHPLGSDPRPSSFPRRAAVRSVHDPPARSVLDVRAGGAALRPDRVHPGDGAGARRRCLRPACPVRDSAGSSVALSHHREPRAQLRRPRRSAAVRLSCTATASCTGPTIS